MSLVPQLLEMSFSAHISIGIFLRIVIRELACVFFVDIILDGVICSSFVCNNFMQIFFKVHLKKRKKVP